MGMDKQRRVEKEEDTEAQEQVVVVEVEPGSGMGNWVVQYQKGACLLHQLGT